jgi:hypothetical protein
MSDILSEERKYDLNREVIGVMNRTITFVIASSDKAFGCALIDFCNKFRVAKDSTTLSLLGHNRKETVLEEITRLNDEGAAT